MGAGARGELPAVRILHYQRDANLKRGGVIRYVLDVAAGVAALGHEVTVASPDVSHLPEAWRAGSPGLPRTLQLPACEGPLDTWKRDALAEVGRAVAGAGVVHVHGTWWPSNIQIARAAERAGVPYVATVHGMLDREALSHGRVKKRLFHALAGRRFFERARAVHVTAEGEKLQAQRWFRAAAWSIVPPVVDFGPFKSLAGPDAARGAFPPPLPGAPVVLFLSRVHPQKRTEVLIDAVGVLKSRGIDCNLYIAGPGEPAYIESLRRRAAERSINDRTLFPGMVGGDLKASLYQLARVFALPSPQESFGLVLVESMACGTPVVAADSIDIAPELRNAAAASLAPCTPEGFAGAIAPLLPESKRREEVIGAGRRWLAEHLDPGRVVLQYEALYRDICVKDRAGGGAR